LGGALADIGSRKNCEVAIDRFIVGEWAVQEQEGAVTQGALWGRETCIAKLYFSTEQDAKAVNGHEQTSVCMPEIRWRPRT